MVLSTLYAATASDLIADINAANTAGGANTIVLTAPTSSPYVLTAVNNGNFNNYNALPVIAAGDHLTILTSNGAANPGYGDMIDASKHGRLFDVANGASLTLENVTLQNGQVWTYTATAEGGAILNQGALVLSQVLVQNNTAYGGGNGQSAAGGGVWSNGSLTVENSSVFANNSAQGSNPNSVKNGGSAYGGGICIAGGTANVTNTFFGAFPHGGSGYAGMRGNSALGGTGAGAPNGSGYGGAVYVASGTVTMNADTIGNSYIDPATGANTGAKANFASGPGAFGRGYGGGAYVAGGTVTLANDTIIYNDDWTYNNPYLLGGGVDIASGAKVYLDSFTKTNTYLNNGLQIVGTYTLFAPQIGAFAASANSATDGASLTLTASNITDANPAATTTQVAFYVQINGTNTLLGYGTQATTGVWSFSFTVNLAPGTDTLVAQAEDSFGVFGNLMTMTLTVQ
jgi:hypothetical protein